MMLGNLAQAKAEILSGLGAGLTSTVASAADVSATTMKLEAVMENFQRHHQQRILDQQKSDDVIHADVRCNGDDFSDNPVRRRSFSSSPKAANDSADDDGNDVASPGIMREDDDVISQERRSPDPEKSSALIAQQVAFAAALAQRASPDGNLSSLSSLMPQAMMQQFGQFQSNFDPSQLPQGFRELALLQQQQIAQRMAVEAQKRMHLQEQQNIQQSHHHSSHSISATSSNASSNGSSSSVTSQTNNTSSNQQEWTYEEQFKQLYEIDEDVKRKEFLDDLFSFMQKRGTPVNRIPIMAKQVLDLYQLYKLVVEKGGLVEVINKKIWREITKGLNLPSSITSAAFTLRTQYMKYLYPFECEREKLSCPTELQAAIEGNRREGRRPSYSSHMFSYSPSANGSLLAPQKFPFHPHNGLGQLTSLSVGKYGQSDDRCLPTSPTQQLLQQHHILQSANAQHVAAMAAIESIQTQAKVRAAQAAQQAAHHAAQQAAQHQMALKKEVESDYSENEQPAEKKLILDDSSRQMTNEETRRSSPFSRSSMKFFMNDRGNKTDVGSVSNSDSIEISMEVNGVTYQGILFARSSNKSSTSPNSSSPKPHHAS
ncbi:protein dead ringer homolog isoform X1 [Clavelina lepadiformis]|uniref:protein dead ringer homolog isoform X1 n=1 Tax=Clavelina lepadiformis TaxID=159417 RepID=UPI0040414966